MPNAAPLNLARLREPFPAADLEWKVQSCGEKNGRVWARVLAYVTARAISDRLDEVCGPENWKNDFREGPAGGVLCLLSIRVPRLDDESGLARYEWITKTDGAENTQVEGVKGGLSGSLKRAASQWGIGRYLYNLEETFARVHDGGAFSAKTKEGKWFKWDAPTLPEWALPVGKVRATAAELAELLRLTAQLRATGEGGARVANQIHERVANDDSPKTVGDALAFCRARLDPASAAAAKQRSAA